MRYRSANQHERGVRAVCLVAEGHDSKERHVRGPQGRHLLLLGDGEGQIGERVRVERRALHRGPPRRRADGRIDGMESASPQERPATTRTATAPPRRLGRRSPRATSGQGGSGCWSPRAQPPARSRSPWNGTVLRQVSLTTSTTIKKSLDPGRPVHLRPDRHPSSQGRLVGQTGRDRRRRSVRGLRSYVGRGSVTSVAERPHPKGQRRLDRPLRCARPGSGALRSVSTPRGNRSTSLPHSRLGPLAERPHPYRTASRNDI